MKITHHYGPQVHILDNSYLNGLLAKLCSAETVQPEINHLVEMLYSHLLTSVMNDQFPQEQVTIPTRMAQYHPDKKLTTTRLKKDQKVISVNLARAGTYPSHICFNALHYAIAPQYLRQDHIFASRAVDVAQKVTGTDIGGTKIGGDKEGAIILFPDPMGATGNTLISAIDTYKNYVQGKSHKMIALHLILTPEYLKNVLTHHPDVLVYALRLDRGLSTEAALNSAPGKMWDQEKGLNDKDYIVPGGGGFGEIMNNSFV